MLREQPPVRPGASGAMLPMDCSELPGQILPAEAPVIVSQPRTGKADYYELTWRPRHERGVPVMEYMIKYRKVCSLLLNLTNTDSVLSHLKSGPHPFVSASGGGPSGRVDVQQHLRLPPQADSGQTAARQPVRGGDGCQKLCRLRTACNDFLQNWQRYNKTETYFDTFNL